MNSFSKPFLTTLGIVAGIAAIPAVALLGNAASRGAAGALTSPKFNAYQECWKKSMDGAWGRIDTNITATLDGGDRTAYDPLDHEPSARIKRDCGEMPAQWIWQ